MRPSLRKSLFVTAVAVTLQIATAGVPFAQGGAVLELSSAFREAIAKVKPAVVSISAEREAEPVKEEDYENIPEAFKRFIPEEFFYENYNPKRSWQGSGAIISEEGEILTNFHVVNEADVLNVTLDDGREMDAEILATDKSTDIALIKLKGEGPFPFCSLGDSDSMRVGDWVLAIGNPFGLSQSVSEGIVSAKGRTDSDVPVGRSEGFLFKDFIQTTAAINPGNSGGPLINLMGEVIGVNNAIQTAGVPANLGIGFAIPSNMAKNIVVQLKEFGKVRRGYLGVWLNSNETAMNYFKERFDIAHGALVDTVNPDTPAERAGLKHGDLILSVEGEKVRDNSHLTSIITQLPVGEEVSITILRGEERMDKTLVLAERPPETELAAVIEDESGEPPMQLLGIAVRTLTPEIAKEKGYEEDLKGVIVVEAAEDGPAAEADIQVDDVISEMNDKSIETAEQFAEILAAIRKDMEEAGKKEQTVLMYKHRAGARLRGTFVAPTIKLPE